MVAQIKDNTFCHLVVSSKIIPSGMKKEDHFQKYKDLREKFPEFCYENFNYKISDNNLNIQFHFSLSNQYHFYPSHELPVNKCFKLNSTNKK